MQLSIAFAFEVAFEVKVELESALFQFYRINFETTRFFNYLLKQA